MFGGAFDPPHRAHVALAQAAVAQLALDALVILPTGNAWHKARVLTDASHRLAMARLAFAGVPRAVVDDREMRRAGPTYTVETLRELGAENPGAELFLVMGQDQADAFATWRDWETIAALATLAVAGRPHAPGAGAGLPAGVRSIALQLPPMDESATDVRARLASGRDITPLVPTGVASYIASNHLYRPT